MARLSLRATATALFLALRRAAIRFPLPLACAAGYTLFSNDFRPFGLARDHLLSLLFLSFFLTLAVKLWCESRQWSVTRQLIASLGAFGLLAFHVYGLPVIGNPFSEGPVLFLGPAFVLLVMTAAFLHRDSHAAAFWDFNRAAWLGAAFGLLIALLLAIGLHSAYFAIEELFGLKLGYNLEEKIWTVAFALVWPWYALSAIPERFTIPEGDYCPRLIGQLISFLLVPLVLVYLVILYAYMAKIAIAWELPKGQVAGFTAGYATFGVIVHLLTYPLRQTGHLPLRLFHRFFYPALFAPVAILVLAVWLRIDSYGVTEDRYLLLLFALWLAVMALLFTTVKTERLTIIPIFLALLLILASFGPWSAAGLSTSSQLARLEQLLADNSLLKDGKILPNGAAIPWEDEKRISSIVTYLVQQNRVDALEARLAGLEIADRHNAQKIVAAMGLRFINAWQEEARFSYSHSKGTDGILDVTGYRALIERNIWNDQPVVLTLPSSLQRSQEPYTLRLNSSDAVLTLFEGDKALLQFELWKQEQGLSMAGRAEERDRLMVLEHAQNGWRGRLLITAMSGKSLPEGPTIEDISFILLLGRAEDPT